MATKIVTKNSSTASAVPTASDLVQGELAVNVADKRLFTENNAGAIVELGTNPTTLNVNGTATMDGLVVDGTAFVNLTARPTGVPATAGALWSAQIETGNYGIVSRASSTDSFTYIGNTGSSATLGTSYGSSGSYLPLDLQTSDKKRLRIASSGDISFYEDTGTTAKFFWDASAESLGIGTSSPSAPLNISATYASDTTEQFRIQDNTGSKLDFFGYANGGKGIQAYADNGSTFYNLNLNPLGGNVGIGTSSPSNKLEIRNDVSASVDLDPTAIKLYNNSDGGSAIEFSNGVGAKSKISLGVETTGAGTDDSYLGFSTGANTALSERMRIDSAGNVGIGNSSPSTFNQRVNAPHLVVGAGSNAAGLTLYSGTSNQSSINFAVGTTTTQQYDGGITYHPSSYMGFHTNNGAERMRISSAGHTTFGTTDDAPGAGNTVAGVAIRGGSDNRTFLSANGNYSLHLNRNSSDGVIQYFARDGAAVGSIGVSGGNNIYISGTQTNHAGLTFATDAILPTRQGVGIDNVTDLGASSERFKDLYLSGTANVGSVSSTGNITANGVTIGSSDIRSSSNILTLGGTTERMRIDSSGNLLVGTTSFANPASGFTVSASAETQIQINHVNGTGSGVPFATFRYNQSQIGSITQNGTSATLYNTSSDQRLKENIADADDAGSKIDAIQVRQYDWKADGSHQDYGMIAQELQAVAPEAVSGDADSEDMMGVDYSKLVPMLVKEIQSLRNRVAQLEE